MTNLTPIEQLGVAISNAGITWTNEMRAAWDKAKDDEVIGESLAAFWVSYCKELQDTRVAAADFFKWFNRHYPAPSDHPDHEWHRLGMLLSKLNEGA